MYPDLESIIVFSALGLELRPTSVIDITQAAEATVLTKPCLLVRVELVVVASTATLDFARTSVSAAFLSSFVVARRLYGAVFNIVHNPHSLT